MKQKITIIISLILILSMCASCAAKPKSAESQIFAMDTVMSLTAYGKNADEALKAATGEINRLDKMLSANDADSEVSKVNASAGSFVPVSDAVLKQLAVAKEVSDRSGGAFDISIQPLVELWGFGTGKEHVPADGEIAAARSKLNYKAIEASDKSVKIPQGTEITLAAIAKGYTSQHLSDMFRSMGISSAIVSLGGNVQAVGAKPDGSKWRVAVQDPTDTTKFLGTIDIADLAAVTSGGYQRYFEENGVVYHHILDPKTGRPAESGLSSVTIVCTDGTLADALSTTLFVLGEEKAKEYWRSYGGFEAVLVTVDGRVVVTEGLKSSFSLSGSYKLQYAGK